jgi:sialate O-acetylesterase
MKKTIFLLLVSLTANQLFAVSLPRIFGDNMVLQQNAQVLVWGFGKAGEGIALTASWQPETALETVADSNGKWQIWLQTPRGSCESYTLDIMGYNPVQLKNVQIGEVWFASGQSNMEMSANWGIDNEDTEIAAADYPNIRFFRTDYRTAQFPQEDLGGVWEVCTPETMQNFSAIGYFFARDLLSEIKVPVGVICSAWGGTYIESWMPESYFADEENNLPKNRWGPNEPALLFNAMVRPIIPYKIAGILWYQGEQNVINALHYSELLKDLITSWRNGWGNEDLPFYFAQIAPYSYGDNFSGVEIRNAQLQVAMNVPNTAMIMTSDICTTDDIHPKNKQGVGKRFAETALEFVYDYYKILPNTPSRSSAPIPSECVANKNAVFVHFENYQTVHFKPKNMNLFEIAGADGKYYPAKAVVKSKEIELTCKEVKNPAYVRYGWGNTILPDLFNENNLPLSSFELKVKK